MKIRKRIVYDNDWVFRIVSASSKNNDPGWQLSMGKVSAHFSRVIPFPLSFPPLQSVSEMHTVYMTRHCMENTVYHSLISSHLKSGCGRALLISTLGRRSSRRIAVSVSKCFLQCCVYNLLKIFKQTK